MQCAVNSGARKISPGHALNLLGALFAALFVISFFLLSPVAAQSDPPVGFTEEELQAFAAASLEVEEVRAKWEPRLADAETAEETATLRQQAVEEMADAVRDQGLSVGQYNGIFAAAEQNPELMGTLQEYRNDLQ